MSEKLREAAQAVIDRWDSPKWEWVKQGPTAVLINDLRAALEQQEQEQEPAAWISKRALIRLRVIDATVYPDGGFDDAVPLYATLPRREWQGLTESEIQAIHDYYVKRLGPVEFACAIEAAPKEKNK